MVTDINLSRVFGGHHSGGSPLVDVLTANDAWRIGPEFHGEAGGRFFITPKGAPKMGKIMEKTQGKSWNMCGNVH